MNLIQLGRLVQGKEDLLICCSRNQNDLYMLKDVGSKISKEMELAISLFHESIVSASFTIAAESGVYIGLKYARHTLEELLCVHIAMDEAQVRAIATSVSCSTRMARDLLTSSLQIFAALKYLNSEGYAHGRVNEQTIRICRSGRVMLGESIPECVEQRPIRDT